MPGSLPLFITVMVIPQGVVLLKTWLLTHVHSTYCTTECGIHMLWVNLACRSCIVAHKMVKMILVKSNVRGVRCDFVSLWKLCYVNSSINDNDLLNSRPFLVVWILLVICFLKWWKWSWLNRMCGIGVQGDFVSLRKLCYVNSSINDNDLLNGRPFLVVWILLVMSFLKCAHSKCTLL